MGPTIDINPYKRLRTPERMILIAQLVSFSPKLNEIRQGTDSSVELASPTSESSNGATVSTDGELERTQNEDDLPNGWEKHEDNDGPYYWHIKSGTIQREPPEKKEASSQPAMNFQRQVVPDVEASGTVFTPVVPRSTTSFTLSDLDSGRSTKEELAYK